GYLVANRIETLRAVQHDPYGEYAILYRTNAQSRVLEESLRKRNIPYRIYGGLSFYQRKEVKDALAYFRLSLNPDDDEALKRVVNYPARGIGDTTIAKVTRCAIDSGVSLWQVISSPETYDAGLGTAPLRKLESFVSMIRAFIAQNESGDDAYAVASRIISDTRLLAMVMSDTTPESISRRENLEELLSGVKDFVAERTESGESDLSLAAFMADVSLATDQDNDTSAEDGPGGCVTLMTVHASKGLEFGNVFIVGVEEELFPSSMSDGSMSAIEEERRLLYVAITRAKRFCMMSYATSRFRNGQTVTCSPSRFLRDISVQYMHLTGGTTLTGLTRSTVRPTDNYRSSTITTHKDRSSAPSAPRFMSVSSPAKSVVDTEAGLHTSDELTVGAEIRHSRFGQGTIIRIDTSGTDAKIEVEFAAGDTKTLLLKYARFVIL
ncbi:MAG: ATP-binding domain-containing protein, partial [Muribaculaceae bacterium]|nr:ATP-binding domain-containing protein [Muribaculaceae bacterium]